MSGEAINPERAYMVTATNLPVAELIPMLCLRGALASAYRVQTALVYVRSARHARHRQAQ